MMVYWAFRLVLLFLIGSAATALSLLHVLPLNATWTATAEGRFQREVNVFL